MWGKTKQIRLPSTAIVIEMMQKCDLLNKGYSSPNLFHRLFSAGTNICGTVRTNRKPMPKELAKEKLKVGEAVAYSSTNITAMKWKDKREVSMLSIKHTLDFAETGKVHPKMQTKIMKRTAVIDYNMKMRGVDVGDQILKDLLESYLKENVGKRRSATPGDVPSCLSCRHFPEKLAPSVAKGAKFAERCVVCLEKK
ncbi:hypothetical protein PR048_026724, partial [Dryococelus australis]